MTKKSNIKYYIEYHISLKETVISLIGEYSY